MAGRHQRRLKPGLKLAGIICAYTLVMGGVAYGVVSGYRYLHVSPFFQVQRVVFQGTSLRTEPAMRSVFATVREKNLLALDLRPFQEKVLEHAWVESVALHRELPDTLYVVLKERNPVGVCQVKGKTYLFDKDGELIDTMESGQMMLDTPVLRGIREESLREDLLFGFQFLSELREENQAFWNEMEELDIADRENIVAHSALVQAPLYLGRHPEPGNLSRFLSVVPYLNQNYPELEYVELAVPKQVVVMPRGGAW